MSATNENRWGFPIENCARCKGSGQYSFNPVDGTRCYGCGGRGTTVTRNAREAWSQFEFALYQYRNPAVRDVKVGDVLQLTIISSGGKRRATVLAMSPTTHDDGVVRYELTLDCGTNVITMVVREDGLVRRVGNIDPAPYLATITGRRG